VVMRMKCSYVGELKKARFGGGGGLNISGNILLAPP
ncbi:MAG: hypothetical protein ACI90V_011312, partial [Bacillariaceae sp.]